MKLTIDQNIPDSATKPIVIAFAKMFAGADLSELPALLSEDCRIVWYDKETVSGKNRVIASLESWMGRVSQVVDALVKWCPYYSRPALYLHSLQKEIAHMVLLFHVSDGKIDGLILTRARFSSVGFSVDDTPYNIEFIKVTAQKPSTPKANRNFCPICGKASEALNWFDGIICKGDYNKKTGFVVYASICPDCNRPVEVNPDRTVKFVITQTREQHEKALTMPRYAAERAQWIDFDVVGVGGNRKPRADFTIPSRTSELAAFGAEFYKYLNEVVVPKHSAKLVFQFLDKLTLDKEAEMEIHVSGDDFQIDKDDLAF